MNRTWARYLSLTISMVTDSVQSASTTIGRLFTGLRRRGQPS